MNLFNFLSSMSLATSATSSSTSISPAESFYNSNSPSFLWGSATASYQVEGAYMEDGRGMTVWDDYSHTPGKVANGDTGDVATDHYHRYIEDIQLMKDMGINSYRLSLAWSRILPNGEGQINQAGIDHYNKVFDALEEANIIPFVTLFHWDTPSALENKYGGWLSDQMETFFTEYADACFKNFGSRVKHWLTINEPMSVVLNGYYYGINAPGHCSDRSKCDLGDSPTEPYIVAHNMLNAHAAVVALYRSKYQSTQNGVIGITLNSDFAYPLDPNSVEDQEAAQRNLEFQAGWYADPVFFGHYPQSMVEAVGDRLPSFTAEQSERIKGSYDFYGLNHYTSKYATYRPIPSPSAGWSDDQATTMSNTDSNGNLIGAQAASSWLNVVPSGMYDLLKWLSARYNNPVIMITENGVDAPGETELPLAEALHDTFRVDYYSSYLASVMQAMDEGVRVKGYFAWSLMDNFEWADGYDYRFGLHYVDYDNNLTRYPKDSAKWFANYTKYHP